MNTMKNPDTAENTMRTAGDAVRRVRGARQVSLRQLANSVGVSPATMSAIETGKTGLTVRRLHQIADALDVPATDLLENGRPGPPYQPTGTHPTVAVATGDWREFVPLPIDSVLAGAIRAFVATGYHGASMRSIAIQANRSVPGVYHHYSSKQELLVRILDITMTDLIWRVEGARDEGSDPIEKISLIVEALALYHTRRIDLAFIGASEMRSLESPNYRRIAELRNRVQHLLDEAINAAIADGGLSVANAQDAGKAIATMCTALPQWFRPDGATTPEHIATEYAHFALRLLGDHTH